MNNSPLVVEKLIQAPVALVWKALTSKEEMKNWYFDLKDFKPEVGFEFSFYGQGHKGEQYLHLCRVTEVIEERKLAYTWTYKGYEGHSLVTFELFPETGKTRVRVTHKGLDSFPANNPDFAAASFLEGWTYIIGTALPGYLEKQE